MFLTMEPNRPPKNERINAYCRLLLELVRCNQDMKIICDPKLCFYYLLKYVTKQEEPSKFLEELVDLVNATNSKSVTSLAAKIVFKAMGKRDMSTQEVACLIYDKDLYETDINFVHLSLGDDATYYRGTVTA